VAPPPSPNFAFLAVHDPELTRLGADAERFFARDPDVSLVRLRQLGERLAQRAAAMGGVLTSPREAQVDLLRRLQDRRLLTPDVSSLFHALRRTGNQATHEALGDHREALLQLKVAKQLAVWFHATFGTDAKFRGGPFVPPPDPAGAEREDAARAAETAAVRAELGRLRAENAAQRTAAEAATAAAEEEARRRVSAEERARREAEDHAAAMALAEESEAANAVLAAAKARLEAELAAIQARAAAAPAAEVEKLVARAKAAGARVTLDEAATRQLVDRQLRDAGWEADSERLTHARGARPQKGKSQAIAEWPTDKGPADYVLFAGLTPVGVVEAKRQGKDVPASIEQSKRYSRAYRFTPEETPAGGPWGEHRIPFLFATNGRPYLRQMLTKSGIWFLDARRPENHAGALEGWHTPDGLSDLLKLDVDAANAALAAEAPDTLEFLRPYQRDAIRAAEAAIAGGARACLLAMATGTGKTKTCIGLVYRLIKARRFRRILFLVDRSALGEQARDAFMGTMLDGLQPFHKIFDLKGMKDVDPDRDTKVHIATIQAMARRVLAEDGSSPPVDRYDCIVVDECHRGYLLDRELGDAELTFRDEEEYISAYRRVLDHFDAVKIGLTATPALHTKEIFGAPVYEYRYRDAVADGTLVDHEMPLRIVTALAADGIHWAAGEERLLIDRGSGETRTEILPDEVSIDIESFNRRVITEPFNEAVCGELVKHIDPSLPEKTLIFCVDDDHADLVVKVLKKALDGRYLAVDDDAVQKITGKADKPLERIRRFRNEPLPRIAVTVDLLTTGIDVPAIANLVFLRRVRSRILYEQMLGRATRRCDAIGKESFRIFDAVDLYSALAPTTDMKPVAVRPNIPFAQLVGEIMEVHEQAARQALVDQLLAKLHRKKRLLTGENLDGFHAITGLAPDEMARALRGGTPAEAAAWLLAHEAVGRFLDQVTGGPTYVAVSNAPDEVREVTRSYGKFEKPGDYLAEFSAFLKENLNKIPALVVVTTRPRELTRKQLRELKLALDGAGYGELALRTAWREMTNEDIAASILGHVRRAALGDALVPYEARVDRALKKLLGSRAWTTPQRQWLEKIGNQLKVETVVDREAFEQGLFKTNGGYARFDKIFDGRLAEVLGEIGEGIWQSAG
jgi:type I restriction enzyme R subunit